MTVDLETAKQYAANVAKSRGHWLEPWQGQGPHNLPNDPIFARCSSCNGTVEVRREDGSYTGPCVEAPCPAEVEAQLAYMDGIRDSYAALDE